MFCFISYLIIITTCTILSLGDMNLYYQLKAMLETFLKGNCSKTLTSRYIATDCIIIIIFTAYCYYLKFICSFISFMYGCVLSAEFYRILKLKLKPKLKLGHNGTVCLCDPHAQMTQCRRADTVRSACFYSPFLEFLNSKFAELSDLVCFYFH